MDDSYGVFQLNGSTWNSIQTGLPNNTLLTSMAFYGNKILLGTLGQGVFTREVASGTWVAVNNGLTNLNVTAVATNGNKLFAGTDGAGVFVANLDAGNWMQTAPVSIPHTTLMGLNGSKIQDMTYYGGYIFASYRGGLVASSDNGQSWIAGGNQFNLPSYTNVYKISFVTTRVFVSTENNSVYSNALSELPTVTSVKDINPVLNASIQLFPNPSHGQFAIQLKDVKARIEAVHIYDQQGKMLKNVINVNELQQIKTVEKLSSGVYFVQVRTNAGFAVKRMIVQ